ncbi:D-alanyl-lipoteichoic acid biosynthesis protein DltD [Enterococcus sp. 8G7_MSG3316]|uniref:Protein DltD n=1 Tax=Candidatus Enterococcus testudinis TaxID=1834191 RepID=A0A242A326_9ENTE|nr:D-alanyl-lipoteichoic acid biosynthesis protein DltD [Enterococcus sp. 8G7_MSG3316]OTN75436.1 D-alanyl-lipoteichoic acid biosynthesis protein DltD [Enterococcus sp. 8G7_MSG3316]
MIKQRLGIIFGPLICALVLLAGLFLGPWKINSHNPATLAHASTAMTDAVFQGDTIKNEAIASGQYVPFFGSSELNRISSFHPSVLAQKYNRGYTPFLLGAAGTQSLTQYSIIRSMAKELTGKKAVFIVSPQWFVPKGIKESYFNHHYSEQQVYDWLIAMTHVSDTDVYYANRLLSFSKVAEDNLTASALKEVRVGHLPTAWQVTQMKLQLLLLTREDDLFSGIGLQHNLQGKIDQAATLLPDKDDRDQLYALANEQGQQETNNNTFGIKNSFYNAHLKNKIGKMAGSQAEWEYRYGPEYSDFQLVLNAFAENKVDVLFIIPPINQKWMDYTGLPQSVLSGFAQKIRHQLESQGFTSIDDLSDQGNVDYFMEDTIHLGWQGWLTADAQIKTFLEAPRQAPSYKINNQFLSKEWQEQDPLE